MNFSLKPINIENFVDIQPNMMRLKGYRIGVEHRYRAHSQKVGRNIPIGYQVVD